MDESTKKLLDQTYRLAEENNKYLKKIDRRQRLNFYWRLFIMILAVVSALGIYYYVQPYIDQVITIYNQVEKNVAQFGTVPEQIKSFLPFKK